MPMPLEKLKKVVEMAKHAGSIGERANARRILERECKERGISAADAIAGKFGKHDGMPFVFFDVDFTSATSEFYYPTTTVDMEDVIRRNKKSMKDLMEMFRKQKIAMQKAQDDLKAAEARRKAAVAEAMRRAGR